MQFLSFSLTTPFLITVGFLNTQLDVHLTKILKRSDNILVFGTVFLVMCFFVLFFLATPSLAVFAHARAFNQDVSKWNTGAVTDMENSKATPSVVEFLNTTSRVSSDHMFCYFVCFLVTVLLLLWCVLSFLLYPLLQCLLTHVRSIRTSPNGIRVR